MPIPPEISRDDLLRALAAIDDGRRTRFAQSTGYDLVHEGRRYPPKAVIGLAAEMRGVVVTPEDFRGGRGPGQANPFLEARGFVIETKATGAHLVLHQYRTGSNYRDQVGDVYHFPHRYLKQFDALPAKFVYYEPRSGGAQVYFGTGTIVEITPDPSDSSSSYATVHDFTPFEHPVSYYSGPNGQPWEPWQNMRNSVRRINHELLDQIVAIGGVPPSDSDSSTPALPLTADQAVDPEAGTFETYDAEGRRRLEAHLSIERDHRVVRDAKNAWLARDPSLRCEVCGFSFAHQFGAGGHGVIDAHHIQPLSTLDAPRTPRIEDLAPVCPNCHRMLHRDGGRTIAALRALLCNDTQGL